MLKAIVTLFRGIANKSAAEAIDRHAIIILDQQIRDSAQALVASRQALAVAIAQDRAETRRAAVIRGRSADLERRAVEALKGGRQDMAEQAAESIASLEADADAVEKASRHFAGEAVRLRRSVADAEARLAALERGCRIAQASETVRRLKATTTRYGRGGSSAPLAEAEATLRRLEEQQARAEAANEVLDDLDPETRAEGLTEKLAAEGFGPRTRPSTSDVMQRLRQQAESSTQSAA